MAVVEMDMGSERKMMMRLELIEVGLGMVGRGLRWEKKSLERMRFAELV